MNYAPHLFAKSAMLILFAASVPMFVFFWLL